METSTQANSAKLNKPRHLNFRTRRFVSQIAGIPPLVSEILEESKRLEKINRKISKTTGEKILNLLSKSRKVSPPIQAKKNLSNLFENLLKKPEETQKNRVSSSAFGSQIYELPKLTLRSENLRSNFMPSENFSDIDFKQVVWPEESVIGEELYQVMMESTPKEKISDEYPQARFNKYVAIPGHIRIRSRIGELSRKHEKIRRMTAESSRRKESPRISSPWTFTGNECACIFNLKP